MPSSTPASDSWSDHRLRQIKAAACFVASVLEAPYYALIDDENCELFVSDVANLQEWLTPCAQWSLDEKTQPAAINPALFDALFSLWGIFSRLRFPTRQNGDHSMGLQIEVFCAKPLRKQFKEAVEKLCRLVDQQTAAHSEPNKLGEDLTPIPATAADLGQPREIQPPNLNEAESNILEALGDDTLTGEKLAAKAGYPFNSNFRKTLSGLVKRHILANHGRGYFRKK